MNLTTKFNVGDICYTGNYNYGIRIYKCVVDSIDIRSFTDPETNKVTSVIQYIVRTENRRSFDKETVTVSDTDLFKTKEEVAKYLMTLVAERIADQLKELKDLETGGTKDGLCF